jgi:predicted RNase H-like HicB family nuclease
MAVRYYRAVLNKQHASDWGVTFPDFPGCVSQGETQQEAARMAEEALALHVEGLLADQERLPEPSGLGDPLPDWLAPEPGDPVVQHQLETLVRVEVSSRAMRLNSSLPEHVVATLDRAAAQGATPAPAPRRRPPLSSHVHVFTTFLSRRYYVPKLSR